MKTTKKITVVGNSLGIVLDKALLTKMKLTKGDLVEIDFKKVEWRYIWQKVYIKEQTHINKSYLITLEKEMQDYGMTQNRSLIQCNTKSDYE